MVPSIDLATMEDVPELARLRWELYEEQEGSLPESFEDYRDRFVGFAIGALATGRWHAWVARVDGKPVGAMWLETVIRIPLPGKQAGPIGYLTNVFVRSGYRDHGLGASLLESVLSWCREQGYSSVITWPTARSRPFYRRGGFDSPGEPFILNLRSDPSLNG